MAGLLVLCVSLLDLNKAAAAASSAQTHSTGSSWFSAYNAQSFRRAAAPAQVLNPKRLNRALLDAAVFHETNVRRQKHGLARLLLHPQARQMARMQSRGMADMGEVSHEHPDRARRTLSDRAQAAGLKGALFAENVASAFGRNYRSGDPFYVREENGRKIPSQQPNGPPIPRHTYLSFAVALVDSWMASPGHRRNILLSEATHLGTACEPSPTESTMETFYCTQVFFTPFRSMQR
jgi:uncharacterized protein YkwD